MFFLFKTAATRHRAAALASRKITSSPTLRATFSSLSPWQKPGKAPQTRTLDEAARMKYVLVSGGVISGVGKGIIASSTGLLLKTVGLKVSMIKVDPYLNVDAGLMNPKEHGEVFVLNDGGETDLDLGNYERYLGINLTRDNNITTGKVYLEVIERERKGGYLGKTIQVVPHITDAIQDWIERVAKVPVDDSNVEPDVCVIELGGTVGDIESMPFVEALRQLRRRAGKDNFLQIHVSYVPIINGEQKTKPTQHAVKDVRSAGLIPDLVACRCEKPLEPATISKIAHHCQVDEAQVIAVHDMPSIYQVPSLLKEQGLVPLLRHILNLDGVKSPYALVKRGDLMWTEWKDRTSPNPESLKPVTIALVGKYVELHDAYMSVVKALEHSAMRCKRELDLIWVDAEHLEPHFKTQDSSKYQEAWDDVNRAAGILVPGGFGHRGTEGMMAAAKYARDNKKPYLGICLGMQIAVIEFARNICGILDASSEEFEGVPSQNHVVMYMPEVDKTTMGATMRLGLRPTIFQEGSEWSRLRALYGENKTIMERHRHRYEVNPEYIEKLEASGLCFIGKDDAGKRMEIIEFKDHPFFVGVQFHPEYLSRVLDPSKPYLGFVAASAGYLSEITKEILNGVHVTVNGVNGVNGTGGNHF